MLTNEPRQEPIEAIVLMYGWLRVLLVVFALLAVAVFAVAARLDPYYADGSARSEETHRQLGLPSCTFKFAVGVPCPSCGMTTSFALLIRGDVLHSLRANCAGTLLAVVTLAFIPWALVSAYRGHMLYVRSFEKVLTRVVILFVVLMLVRWAIVLLVYYT